MIRAEKLNMLHFLADSCVACKLPRTLYGSHGGRPRTSASSARFSADDDGLSFLKRPPTSLPSEKALLGSLHGSYIAHMERNPPASLFVRMEQKKFSLQVPHQYGIGLVKELLEQLQAMVR